MGTSLQTMDIALPVGSLEAYTHWVSQIPLLSYDEEQELARRWYDAQDLCAARQLVMAHLRFVVRIARGYDGYGLAQGDLIQEGNIGLMKAVKRFDPNVGVRLVSFAVHWIKAEIHEFILRNWRIVKVATTKAQRKLFFNLRKAKKRLGWFNQEEINAVAKDLGVSSNQVVEMESRLNAKDLAYDYVSGEDKDEHTPAHYLEDHSQDPAKLLEANEWSSKSRLSLKEAMARLDARSQDILEQRWLAQNKATLHQLAAKYAVSAERIRQLEVQAMRRLQDYLQD